MYAGLVLAHKSEHKSDSLLEDQTCNSNSFNEFSYPVYICILKYLLSTIPGYGCRLPPVRSPYRAAHRKWHRHREQLVSIIIIASLALNMSNSLLLACQRTSDGNTGLFLTPPESLPPHPTMHANNMVQSTKLVLNEISSLTVRPGYTEERQCLPPKHVLKPKHCIRDDETCKRYNFYILYSILHSPLFSILFHEVRKAMDAQT